MNKCLKALTSVQKEKLFSISLFSDLSDDEISDVLEQLDFVIEPIRKGDVIIKQDTPCDYLHILLDGILDVNIVDVMGNNVKVETLCAPRAFATPHIFNDNDIFPATFTVDKSGTLFKATKESVFILISRYPVLLKSFLKERGNCNACTVGRLRILNYRNIRSRFIYYLMQRKESPSLAILEHNQTQLAEYLSVSRPALASELKKMVDERLIEIRGKQVKLLAISSLLSYI